MVLNRKKSLLLALLFLFSASLFALGVPPLTRRVTDNAGIMNSSDINNVEQKLAALEQQTGVQMAVLTIKSLEGEDLASYSMKVCETWKLGRSDKDNGVLLLVAYNERKVRIEVGYGLEGDLTDTKCGLVIRNVIIPQFKNGNYSKGIVAGIDNLCGIVGGDPDAVASTVRHEIDESSDVFGLIFMVFWLIFVFAALSSKNGLLKWVILSNLFGRNNHRHYNPGPHIHVNHTNFGGNGFGGGFGGGGFHGGGGHFGGGGASGGW